MNWIGVLVDKRTERFEDTPYDEGLFGVVSDRGAAMDALEDWLKQEFWNFNLGWNQFDGHSEGLCLLAGIDPEHSNSTVDQYGPVFLPSSRDGYLKAHRTASSLRLKKGGVAA